MRGRSPIAADCLRAARARVKLARAASHWSQPALAGMQEHERIALEVLDGDADDVLRAREPRMRVADAALALQAARPQPFVRQREALAAMIVLAVVDRGPGGHP